MDVILSACTQDMWERRVIQIQSVCIVLVVVMFLLVIDKRGKSHQVLTRARTPLFQSQSDTNMFAETPVATYVDVSITDKTVFLQSAIASISRSDCPTGTIKARMIFETGSQRSFVSNRVKNGINLPC